MSYLGYVRPTQHGPYHFVIQHPEYEDSYQILCTKDRAYKRDYILYKRIPPEGRLCSQCEAERIIADKEISVSEGKVNKENINPKHYKMVVNGQPIQVVDIIEAFAPENAHVSQALKYLLRAGRKEGNSYLQDMSKALWWIARGILFKGGKVILPETDNE